MTEYNRIELSRCVSKYYNRLLNTCKMRLRMSGCADYSQDIVQNAMLWLCSQPDRYIEKLLQEYHSGSMHLFNLLRMKITRMTIDNITAKRAVFGLIEDVDQVAGGGDFISYSQLSEAEYAEFRNMSCNIRSDDFIDPNANVLFVTPIEGWVSGWVHSYKLKGRRYTYWQYSAFIGSRSKGHIPRRIKTSTSRHEAYIGLMKYNKQLYDSIRPSC